MDNEPDGFNILLKRLARRKDGKVKMVGNNPFEARHAEDNMHGKFLDWTLIRPFGTVRKDLMPLDVPEEKRVKAAWVHHGLLEGWKRYMENNNLTDLIEYLPEKYGGPLTLRKYKFLVSVPYQVSFMKVN